MSDQQAELLPCPFCGERPETMYSGIDDAGLMIECITPGCVNPHTSYYDHASAIRVWTTRATPKSSEGALLDEALAALRAAKDQLENHTDNALAQMSTLVMIDAMLAKAGDDQ